MPGSVLGTDQSLSRHRSKGNGFVNVAKPSLRGFRWCRSSRRERGHGRAQRVPTNGRAALPRGQRRRGGVRVRWRRGWGRRDRGARRAGQWRLRCERVESARRERGCECDEDGSSRLNFYRATLRSVEGFSRSGAATSHRPNSAPLPADSGHHFASACPSHSKCRLGDIINWENRPRHDPCTTGWAWRTRWSFNSEATTAGSPSTSKLIFRGLRLARSR